MTLEIAPEDRGRIQYDGEHATIVFERRLAHPPDRVWRAITDPKELTTWYLAEARIDGRVGGTVELVPGTADLRVTGRILVWDPPRVFEHEWNVDPWARFPQGERTVVRWELTEVDRGTILRLTHRGLTRRTANGFVSGIHAILDRLAAGLDGRPLPEWRARTQEVSSGYPGWTD